MNFDKIKTLMDSESTDDIQIPNNLNTIKESEMPIQKIRKTMKGEIVTQLACILIFFTFPALLIDMYEIPRSVYYITMFITCLITLGYLAKMIWFLSKTKNMAQNSKDVIVSFIYDLKLTLEVYKTAIISGSLLLPLSILALLTGAKVNKQDWFSDLFLFNTSIQIILLCIFGYLIAAIFIYFVTLVWTDKLYVIHIKKLEKVLEQLNS